MAFQFSVHGTREAVLRKLAEVYPPPAADVKDDKLPHVSDRAQVEAVRVLVAAEIAAVDPKVNGVRVICEASAVPNMRTVTLTVIPQEFVV